MKVAIVSGSIRKGRQSHKVAYFLRNKLVEWGVETDLLDLALHPLPPFGQDTENTGSSEGAIKEISNRLHKADALLLVTPEYHGSFSGVLKNALDYFWSEFSKKPIGVAAAAAGRMGGINASTQLQHVILSVGAYPLPLKFLVPEIQNTFDDSFKPLNGAIALAAENFLEEFLWFAEAIADKKRSTSLVNSK